MGLHSENIVAIVSLTLTLICVLKCDLIDSTNDNNNDYLYNDNKGVDSDIPEVVDDVVPRAKRSTGNGLVTIARFKSGGTGKMFPAYVDDTMTRLIFQVSVERSEPLISTLKPSGSPYTIQPTKNGTASQGTVVATLDIPITSSDYGFWKFKKNDATTWDVTILGESPVSITHELFEIGSKTSVNEYPVIGKQYNVQITVAGMNYIHSSDFGMIISKDKLFPLKMDKLISKGHDVFEMSNVTMPAEPIMIGIQGKDNSSHMYKRLDDKEVIPVTLELFVPPYTGTMIEVHTTFNITFTVTNIMPTTQDIDVRIDDDKNLVQSPKVITQQGLAPGDNFTGIFQLKAGNTGITTMVKIQARQNKGGGNFTSGPIEWRNFTIYVKTTTSVQPTLSSTGKTTPKLISTKASSTPSLASKSLTIASSVTTMVNRTTPNTNMKLCDIARFTDSSGPGKTFVVYVDSTMKSLKIKVTVTGSQPVIILATGPSNKTSHPSKSGGATWLDIPITSADYGIWKITKMDSNIWNVVIQTDSPICVTSQLFELTSGTPLNGDPIQEKQYKMRITIQDMHDITSVDQGVLLLKKNMRPGGSFLKLVKKKGNEYEAARVEMPTDIFLVSVQGTDKTGQMFRRIDPHEYNPVSVKLEVPSFRERTMIEHSTFIINFTVTNLLDVTQDIDVRISDERNFVQAPNIFSPQLKPREKVSGNFTLKADIAGLTTVVKVKVVRVFGVGKFGSGPEEVRNFTVITNETTTTSSTTVSSLAITPSVTDNTSTVSESLAIGVIIGCIVVGLVAGSGTVAAVTYMKHKKAPVTKIEPIKQPQSSKPLTDLKQSKEMEQHKVSKEPKDLKQSKELKEPNDLKHLKDTDAHEPSTDRTNGRRRSSLISVPSSNKFKPWK